MATPSKVAKKENNKISKNLGQQNDPMTKLTETTTGGGTSGI
jgi:hypothetical protein